VRRQRRAEEAEEDKDRGYTEINFEVREKGLRG
jgi:hypothetical protein